jgi:hypothetical protein
VEFARFYNGKWGENPREEKAQKSSGSVKLSVKAYHRVTNSYIRIKP